MNTSGQQRTEQSKRLHDRVAASQLEEAAQSGKGADGHCGSAACDSKHLYPVVDLHWQKEQIKVQEQIKDKDVQYFLLVIISVIVQGNIVFNTLMDGQSHIIDGWPKSYNCGFLNGARDRSHNISCNGESDLPKSLDFVLDDSIKVHILATDHHVYIMYTSKIMQ